jgi:hypothetical protein
MTTKKKTQVKTYTQIHKQQWKKKKSTSNLNTHSRYTP